MGRSAAERALRRLGARKVPTQKVPVVFDPAHGAIADRQHLRGRRRRLRSIAKLRSWRANWASAWHPKTSPSSTTARLPGLFGTSPFDDEGVPTRRTVVIDRGVLESYLAEYLYCPQAGPSHHRQRARAASPGTPSVGHGNLFLEKGERSPEEIIRGIGKGLYVTELIGSRRKHRHGRLFARRGRPVD